MAGWPTHRSVLGSALSDDAEQKAAQARMKAIFGGARPTPALKAGKRPTVPKRRREVAPGSLTEGGMGLLDREAESAWEATLGPRSTVDRAKRAQADTGSEGKGARAGRKKKELDVWLDLRDMLDQVGPETRWRAVGYIVRSELERARKAYRVALNIDQAPYKAELIARNGRKFREAFEGLESRLTDMYQFVEPLGRLIGHVERAWEIVDSQHIRLDRVSGHWSDTWPGAEKGTGIPGYDSQQGIDRVRREVREAHERHVERERARAEKRRSSQKPRRRRQGGRR